MGVAEDDFLKSCDGKVKEFYLMTADEVKTALLRNEFKTNSVAVMVDYPRSTHISIAICHSPRHPTVRFEYLGVVVLTKAGGGVLM